MKHAAWRVFLPALLALLVVPLGAASSGEAFRWKVEVVVTMGNVRSTPAMTGDIMARLSKGTVLDAEKSEGPWFKVKLPADKDGIAKLGFVHASVVKVIGEIQPLPSIAPPPEPEPQKVVAPPAAAPPKPSTPRRPSGKKIEISLLGGVGVTMVDVPQAVGIAEKYFEDWSTFHWRVGGQAVYRLTPMLGVGIEFGFHSLYYFYYVYPYTSGMTIRRENTVGATAFGGVVDFRFGGFFFGQAIAGLSSYSDSTLFRFALGLGAEIPIGDFLAVPVMARFDLVPSGASPLALVLGLRAKI